MKGFPALRLRSLAFAAAIFTLVLPGEAARGARCLDYLKAADVIAQPFDSHFVFIKASRVDPEKIVSLGRDERANAHTQETEMPDGSIKQGLQKRTSIYPRRPEQISAWFENLANRFQKIRGDIATAKANGSAAPELMSIDEFFGAIDGAFGRNSTPIGQIMADYHINNIRFVDGEDFNVHVKATKDPATKLKSTEIVLDIPDVDFRDHIAAALWMKNLVLALHEAARKEVAHTLDKAKLAEARELWFTDSGDGVSYKKKTLQLDRTVAQMLNELNDYIYKSAPGLKPEELAELGLDPKDHDLMGLKDQNFKYDTYYPWVTGAIESTVLISGGWGELARGILKIGHPLAEYEPTQLWIDNPYGYKIERATLEKRERIYFSRRARAKGYRYWVTGTALLSAGGFALTMIAHGGLAANASNKLKTQSVQTSEVDKVIDDASKATGKEQMKQKVMQLKTRLGIAEKNNDDQAVIKINKALEVLLIKLQAIDPDGFEGQKDKSASASTDAPKDKGAGNEQSD